MSISPTYREFVLEQLGRVTAVTGKSMFGGVGIYAQGLFFALIAEDRLYFKVDDVTRSDFERRGMEPFRPFGEDSAMGYYELPADVVEDVTQLQTWMKKAMEVAAKAKRKKGAFMPSLICASRSSLMSIFGRTFAQVNLTSFDVFQARFPGGLHPNNQDHFHDITPLQLTQA